MKKIIKILLTMTMIFSLLCTPVFAENVNSDEVDYASAKEEINLDEYIDFTDDIEKDDEEELKSLFMEIIDLDEKLEEKWKAVELILTKYLDEDEIKDIFNEDNQEYEGELEEGKLVISYRIKDGKITIHEKPELENKEYNKYQNNMMAHRDIWKIIKEIIPSKYLSFLTHFEINTDGKEGELAHVAQTNDGDNSKWIISVDLADIIKNNGKLNKKELTETIVHEFGHLLTLNSNEVDQRQPNETESTFVTAEGITKEKSYINQFYQKFWDDIYDEWLKIEEIEDDDEYYDEMDKFYEKYKSRFVSDYAATNPGEDIAETFRIFITEKKPKGDTIAEEKVLFLYSFPELVKMRKEIRKAI